MRRTYAAHLQCHHLPPVRKILHGPIAQVQVLSWLPEGKTQAYRCRPTGREAVPCPQCLLDSLFQSRTEAEQRFRQALDDASLHLRLSLNVAVALGR